MSTISREEFDRLSKNKKPSKYRAKKTVVDGITFDSKKEAARWGWLCIMQRAGKISDLRRQVLLPFMMGDKAMFKLVVDFAYQENGQQVYEDAKGIQTPVFRLKRKLIEKQHGITIRLS